MNFAALMDLRFLNSGCVPDDAVCLWCERVFPLGDRGVQLRSRGAVTRSVCHYHEECFHALSYAIAAPPVPGDPWADSDGADGAAAQDALAAWQSGGVRVIDPVAFGYWAACARRAPRSAARRVARPPAGRSNDEPAAAGSEQDQA